MRRAMDGEGDGADPDRARLRQRLNTLGTAASGARLQADETGQEKRRAKAIQKITKSIKKELG